MLAFKPTAFFCSFVTVAITSPKWVWSIPNTRLELSFKPLGAFSSQIHEAIIVSKMCGVLIEIPIRSITCKSYLAFCTTIVTSSRSKAGLRYLATKGTGN